MNIRSDIPLAPYTTFMIGGPADFFCVVSSEEELVAMIRRAHDGKLPVFILGKGSNILVADEGFRGLVIKNEIKGMETQTVRSEDLHRRFSKRDMFNGNAQRRR